MASDAEIVNTEHLFVVGRAGRAGMAAVRAVSAKAITTPDYDLHYVSKGRGTLTVNGRPFRLSRGDLLLVCPGETFTVRCDADVFERLFIHFDAVGLETFCYPREPRSLFPFRVVSTEKNSHTFGLCLRIIKEIRGGAPHARTLASAYLTELLTGLLRQHGARRAGPMHKSVRRNLWRLIEARRFIENSVERKLTLADMAGRAGLSINYFSRLFRAWSGCTPYGYYVRARIERAKELLIENELSVSEIAETLAFDDVHYFSRAFKKCAGTSPTAYLANIQSDDTPLLED